jgi:predicted nucleotidyltransferase
MAPQIAIDEDTLRRFCNRWKVAEFALFGSVLRDDFGPDSDVDVLVTFAPEARWTLFDMVHMRKELTELFGRDVDLVSRGGLEASRNYLRRKGILSSAQVIHVARP